MERDWQCQCAELRGEEVPAGEPYSLAIPRSHCPECGHPITALENVPVVSWFALRGKCSACRGSISARYPSVEALTGVLTALAAAHFGYGWAAAGAFLLIWSLIALTFIDFDTQLLPDSITLPLLWAGLLFNLFGTFSDLQSAVIGAIAGYLLLWAVYWGFKLATGKEGMGYGDFKLLAALGAWLGWQLLPLIILLSSLVGAVVGIGLIVLAKRGRNVPIPFGPYLAAAGLLALFWGTKLTQSYLHLM
jgi:leader peptidase (prepilin peptidase)/N-methyltransferase